MTDNPQKRDDQTSKQKPAEKVQDLPNKPVTDKDTESVKGGTVNRWK